MYSDVRTYVRMYVLGGEDAEHSCFYVSVCVCGGEEGETTACCPGSTQRSVLDNLLK